MKEDFCTYSQAVRLKKLGFGGNGLKNYTPQGYYKFPNGYVSPIKHDGDGILVQFRKENAEKIPAPSLSQTQKWLREVKELHIQVAPCRDCKTEKISWRMVGVYRVAEFMGTSDFVADVPYSEIDYPNYESALSAGLDAALKLLEEKLSSN